MRRIVPLSCLPPQNGWTDVHRDWGAPHLAAHPEFAWESSLLHDMNAGKWTCVAGASACAGK